MRHKDRIQALEKKAQETSAKVQQEPLRQQLTREEWLRKYNPTATKEGNADE